MVRLAIQFLCDFKELRRALWVKNGCAGAILADYGLESVLILRGLLLEVERGAFQAEVMIACEYEDVFWLFRTLRTAHVIFLLAIVDYINVRVRLMHFTGTLLVVTTCKLGRLLVSIRVHYPSSFLIDFSSNLN